jgi:hypothetical protein
MKNVSWIACCTLLTGFGAGSLAAQPISVQVTGHVVGWQDNTGMLSPYLPLSLPVTATYTYDLGGASVATMQASVGGNPLALNYPGTCQLPAPTSSGRAALLCPGADAALVSLQGITQIDWQVTLTDGSSFTQSVQWNLIR